MTSTVYIELSHSFLWNNTHYTRWRVRCTHCWWSTTTTRLSYAMRRALEHGATCDRLRDSCGYRPVFIPDKAGITEVYQ